MDTSTDSIRVISEADLLDIARIARSTWKNWITKELVDEPANGLYGESELLEAVVVGLLVSALDLRRARAVWSSARRAALDRCACLTADGTLHGVVDLHTWEMLMTSGAREVFAAVRRPTPFPRGYVVVDLSEVIPEARAAFWKRAGPAAIFTADRRRKSKQRKRSSGGSR
jgi:hypothetical protein